MPSTPNARSATSDERRLAWPAWLLLSAALHGILLAYVASWVVSRGRIELRDPLQTRIHIRPEDADRLREFLERNNVNPLQEKVRALEEVAREIAQERERRWEVFQAFEQGFIPRLDESMTEALDRVIETLEAALAEETKASERVQSVDRAPVAEAASSRNLTALAQAARHVQEGLQTAKNYLGRAGHEFERAQARMSEASALVSWVAEGEVTSLWASAVQDVAAAAAARQAAESALGHRLEADRRDYIAYTGSVAQIRQMEQKGDLKPAERKAVDRAHATAQQSASRLAEDRGEGEAVRRAREALGGTLTRLQELRSTLPSRMAQSRLRQAPPREPGLEESPALVSSNAAGLYQAALELEERIARLYRDARASELAVLQALPLEEAQARIQVPRSQPPAVDLRALAGPVRSAQQLKAFEAAFDAAHQHVGGILSAAIAMRDTLIGDASKGAAGAMSSLEQMLERTARLQRVRDLASELTGRVQDLAPAMRELVGAASRGETRPFSGGHPTGQASGGSAAPPGGGGTPGTAGPPATRRIGGIPGQRVTAEGGSGVLWFYVARWYIIGPFPNEGRRNIDTVFPPESVIDLDAVYTGKDGKPIRWEYVSSPTPQITPPDMAEYAIYYAWTELEFDRDCDLWLAIGSDDRSDLWINGVPIWRSSNVLKPWNPWEGFRRVHFRKGRNSILVRLENGWKGCAFSVLVHAGDSDPLSGRPSG